MVQFYSSGSQSIGVYQLCPTVCNPMDSSSPGSFVHGLFHARILESVATAFSIGSSWPRDQTQVSHIAGRLFTIWATREVDCVDHNKLWKILQEMGIPDHLTCLLRNLYAGQEATVRTGHETTDWFQIGKGVCQGSILSPCLFNLYAEYIMWNAKLDEAQAGIKIAGRNINNLRYADDTTLMAESEEEQKRLLMKVKEENEKVGLKLNIQKTEIMASSPITSWQMGKQWKQWLTLLSWAPKSL